LNKIFKNSIFNIIRVFIVTPIVFIIIPYTISIIGTEGYGLWALIGIVAGYQPFVDFGLTTSLVRFVAKAEAQKDINAISEYLATSFITHLFLSSVIVLFIIIFRNMVAMKILGIKENVDIAIYLVTLAALTSIINIVSGLFRSIIEGVQRMDLSNGIMTAQTLFSALGTYIFLENGFGLKGLGINLVIISSLSLLANLYFSKKILSYKINPLLFKWSRFKEMFSYSINIQLSSLIRMWVEPLSKIIISHIFSLSYVGYYEIALKFNKRITSLIMSSLYPIFPAAAELFQKHGRERIENLRKKASRYTFIFSTFICVVLIIIVPDFVKLWLGPEFIIVSKLIVIFLIGLYFMLLATPAYIILNGTGYSKETLFVQIQSVIVNIIGILVLWQLFGFYGFCGGFSLSMLYSFLASHYYYKKRFGDQLKVYKVFLDKKVIVSNVLFFIIGLIMISVIDIDNMIKVIIFVFAFFILYVVNIFIFKVITGTDIELLIGNKKDNTFKTTLQRIYYRIKQ